MIKLACPKCNMGLRVPRQRVPPAGAWAKCPRCQERFFINPAGSSIEDLTRPLVQDQPGALAAAAAGPRQRDQSSQRLLDRLKAKKGQTNEPDYEPGLITVYPEPVIPGYIYQAASVVMLCLPLVVVFLLFNSADAGLSRSAPRSEVVSATVVQLNERANPEMIRQDLVGIKRDHVARRRNAYGVDYSSPESRVFNYFMERLAPDVCSGIHYLEISTSIGSDSPGFTATGLCLEPEGRRLQMKVDWVGPNSRVSFPYNQSAENFSLHPSSTADAAFPAGRPSRSAD